jgi:uncharacterized protein YjbI with pentapeptide repeats
MGRKNMATHSHYVVQVGLRLQSQYQGTKENRLTFRALSLDGTQFFNKKFSWLDLNDCNLSECLFDHCLFENCLIHDICFAHTGFRNCKFINITGHDIDLTNTQFDDCEFCPTAYKNFSTWGLESNCAIQPIIKPKIKNYVARVKGDMKIISSHNLKERD